MTGTPLPGATGPGCPATAHFTRVIEAVTTLTELAAGPHGGRLDDVLAGDDLALARMRAAADVIAAAGMPVDLTGTEGAADLVRQAAVWQNYARGPVTPLHSACGGDIARGLLRLWARRCGGSASTAATSGALAGGDGRDLGRARLRQARVQLAGRIRIRCAALRTELRDDAGSLRRGQTVAFTRQAVIRAAGVARELQETVDFHLGGVGTAAAPAAVDVDAPVPRTAALENRLTWLIGAGFGTGTALTAARLLSEMLPAGGAVVGGVASVAGVIIGGAVVRTRRLLGERAAVDRWVVELTATLRAALDEHLTGRVLAVEAPGIRSSPVRDDTGD